MQYRTQLLVLVTSIVFVSNAVLLGVLYSRSRSSLRNELHSKATSIAASTAETINGDALATLKARRDENSVAYQTLQKTLREVRDSNRRNDVFVEHIYTLMRSPESMDVLRFGVDTSNNEKYRSRVGDVYATGTNAGLSKNLESPYAQPGQGADGSTPFVSGFAPVHDRHGKFVAAIGVGLSTRDMQEQLRDTLLGGLCLLAISTMATFWMTYRFTRPLRDDGRAVGRGAGDSAVATDPPLRRAA
jgi:hypothetical protein